MKNFTINHALAAKKKIFTVLMLVASVFTVSARELHTDLSKAEAMGSNVESWDAATGTFAWKAGNDARILITDIVGDGDLSVWDTLILVTEDYTDSYRLDIELQDGTVLQGSSAWGKFYSAGTKKLALAERLAEDQITSVKNIRINTNSGSGSIVIKDLYLLNDEAPVDNPDEEEEQGQGIEDVKATGKAYKTIENGQLIIIRNGVHFDLTGKVVK